jgi:hypothetical protein
MKIGRGAQTALLLLGLAACAPAERAVPAVTAWQEFRLPGADFAISLPKTPVLVKDTAAADGNVSRTYQASRDKLVYVIAYTASAPTQAEAAPLDQWLDTVRDGIVARIDAKPRGERRFTLGNARGMDVVLDVPETDDGDAYTIRGRFYVRHAGEGEPAEDMLYQTLVAGDAGRETDAAVARFLDSFRFIDR